MGSDIIQNMAYDNYDDFQHVNFIFSQNFISLFCGLFNDGTDHRVRYIILRDISFLCPWILLMSGAKATL